MTSTVFDNEQRPTSTTFPDSDGAGALTSPVVSAGYDLLNRVTSRTNPLGGVTSITFDSFGRVLTQNRLTGSQRRRRHLPLLPTVLSRELIRVARAIDRPRTKQSSHTIATSA